MRQLQTCVMLLAFLAVGGSADAQMNSKTKTRPAIPMTSGFFASLGTQPKHEHTNKMSAAANTAVKNQDPRIVSVPNFTNSFTFGGQTFSYTMVGHQPPHGKVTVPTSYVPISFFFDEFIDANGNNVVIDTNTITDEVKTSPLFENADFATGNTQFIDAQMRAQFFPLLKGNGDFHVLLGTPKTLIPVTVEVPFGSSVVFVLPDGTFFALIDFNFLVSQLNTLLQTEPISVDAIPVFLTRNAVYGDFAQQQPVDCCIGGFHTAFETNAAPNKIFLQTFLFATSLDSDISGALFGDPAIFADINALSHELAETVNDPFVDNVTPNYQIPGETPGVCQDVLEVADVIEDLPPDYTDVTIHGFTYHPQTLGLLQWFEGLSPSDAINGDYSFPDATKLTSPFTPCPMGAAAAVKH